MQYWTKLLFLLLLFLCFESKRLTALSQQVNMDNSCPELTGRTVFRDGKDYDEARLVSNYYTSKNKFPDIIVYCQNAQDVQNAVKWALCRNVSIRIRSGGHNHEGFSTGTGVIVIDVSEMKQVRLDKTQGIAQVGPGIRNKELYERLYKEGFTHVGGTCSDVALSGLTLTGGMGMLLRREGLTCDSLLSFEMVDANGQLIHVTKENDHKDLFWASCGGGGGNFGVITSLTLKVYPVTDVTWFNIGWDWNQPGEEIIAAWQEFFQKPDKRWFSHLDVWSNSFPINEFKKMPIKALGVFWGTPEEARMELAPLLKIGQPHDQMIKSVNWEEAIQLIEESTAVFITSKPEYISSGAFANKSLPSDAIKIIGQTLRESQSPLFNVLLFSMGGAVQEIAPTATAYFYRDAKFFINYTNQWLNKDKEQEAIAELHRLRNRLLPYTVGDYVGNPDSSIKDYLTAYYGDNVERLKCVKLKYDPKNIFHFEQSIPPADPGMDCSKRVQ